MSRGGVEMSLWRAVTIEGERMTMNAAYYGGVILKRK
jgi:hypothetical protein